MTRPAPGVLLELIREPVLEPILHPSPRRLRALALSTAVGHLLYYLAWTSWLPQPYESLWQRLAMSVLGLGLLLAPGLNAMPPSRTALVVMTLVFWITVPVFFTWMYLCNGRNAVWFASMAAMFLMYYHGTDWRIATAGTASGLAAGWALFHAFGPEVPALPPAASATQVLVLGFSWAMSLMLGLSASNLRREQIRQALATMGIMAHELRTPLATMALIGEAMHSQAMHTQALHTQALPGGTAAPADAHGQAQLAARLQGLVRHMNRQIDLQIANAQLMDLPAAPDCIEAGALARAAASAFPYRSPRDREAVQVHVIRDFAFMGTEPLFRQVLDNLMKNALRSLAGNAQPAQPGDLVIEVCVTARLGRITVRDRGLGISPEIRARLFQVFASTQQGTGHGLGLAFCQRVVRAARGAIRVESEPGQGAHFHIDLPLAQRPTPPHPMHAAGHAVPSELIP